MGQIRKVGDQYYIEFYARGLLYSQLAGGDHNDAQKLLEETEAKISNGEAMTIVRDIDVAVFFEQFLPYARQEFGVKSAARFAALIVHFKDFLSLQYPQVTRLSKITPSVIEAYKTFLVSSTKPHLVNFTILLLREILEFGIKLGFINDNPTLHVRLIKLPIKNCAMTKRYKFAQELFAKGVGFGKISKLLGFCDIARMVHYTNLIPLSREDMYN